MPRTRLLSVALSTLLASCGSAPAPAPPAPRPRAPMAAFAIYRDGETILVPVGDRPPTRAAGQWLVAPSDPSRVVHRAEPVDDPESVGLRACPCAQVEGACINAPVIRTIRPAGDFEVEWRGDRCSCYGTEDTPDVPGIVYATEELTGREVRCDPVPAGEGPLDSIVGGTIYWHGSGSSLEDECGNETGYNTYDAWGESAALIEGLATRQPSIELELCVDASEPDIDRLFGEDGALAAHREALARAEAAARDDEDEDEDEDEGDLEESEESEEDEAYEHEGDLCAAEPDLEYLVLRNGELCAIGYSMEPVGEEVWWAGCQPALAEVCPTALDPCGDPEPFRDELDGADAFWVETSGRYALSIGSDGARVHTRGRAPRAAVISIDAGGVEGVLFFSDAGALEAAMQHDYRVAAQDEPDPTPCATSADCASGELCDVERGACHPPCRSDADCSWRGICGARCHEDGLCGRPADGTCDDRDFPCEDGFLCAGGECVQCRSAADCRDGDGCAEGLCGECRSDDECAPGACRDGRCDVCEPGVSASDYGNRCYARIQAGDHAGAEPLCRCGLDASPSTRVRGAILYNLGLIAEARGESAQARAFYEQSLRARENASVRRRLEALAP